VGGNSDYDATQPTAGFRPAVSGTDVTYDADDSLRVREPPGLGLARGTLLTHVVYYEITSAPTGTKMAYQSSEPSDAGSPSQVRLFGGAMEALASMAVTGGGSSSRTITTTDNGTTTGGRLVCHYIGDGEHYVRISGTQYNDSSVGSRAGIGGNGMANLGLFNSAVYDIYAWPQNGKFWHYILTGERTADDWAWLEAYATARHGGI
jgi:hypothetical protein